MVRSVIGIVVGAVLWMTAFLSFARGLTLLWPDYAQQVQIWITVHRYAFTPAMSICNALFWILAEMLAGWITVLIARRREAAWVLAGVIGLYLGFVHLHVVWNSLPKVYNLAVAIPAIPAVLFGGWIAAQSQR